MKNVWLVLLLACTLCALMGCETLQGNHREAGTGRMVVSPRTIKVYMREVTIPQGQQGPLVTVNVGNDARVDIDDTEQAGADVNPDTAVSTGAGDAGLAPKVPEVIE